MIKSFRCKHAEALYRGRPTKRFRAFQAVAERKLQMLDIARRIDDLRIPPANRLEALKGDRQGQFSIRINDQWRLCFRFADGNAYDVEIVDYH
ncbi:MAG: type II toxin-antitoxin system RelE/ParE family toxin [Chromatiaceae bacterium]|jgi:proteic killer suppression protein